MKPRWVRKMRTKTLLFFIYNDSRVLESFGLIRENSFVSCILCFVYTLLLNYKNMNDKALMTNAHY